MALLNLEVFRINLLATKRRDPDGSAKNQATENKWTHESSRAPLESAGM